jgi:oligogalacturonide transport system permease protein
MMKQRTGSKIVSYILLILLAYVMIYPLLWMVGAAFKTNEEIFGGSLSLIPKAPGVWSVCRRMERQRAVRIRNVS